jgi:hypothetical protein
MSIYDSENLGILLDTSAVKLESVLSNIRSLDIKMSVFMAFFGVLLIPSTDILQWQIINGRLVFLKFLPVLLIFIGILFCLFALAPRKIYPQPRLPGLISLYHNGVTPDTLKAELISYYGWAIIENVKVSKKKLRFIRITYISLFSSFMIIALLYILKGKIDA